jgi:hypothetical protein
MRFFFIGPRILGIRPGISFGASELLRLQLLDACGVGC